MQYLVTFVFLLFFKKKKVLSLPRKISEMHFYAMICTYLLLSISSFFLAVTSTVEFIEEVFDVLLLSSYLH